MSATQPTFTLNANTAIPAVGFGTYLISDEDAETAVSTAIEAGYRHIDTASGYQNEVTVGAGIKKGLQGAGMHHQRCEIDRRSVRVRLTDKGRKIRDIVAELFARHAEGLENKGVLGPEGIQEITSSLKRMERYWTDQIRYIY